MVQSIEGWSETGTFNVAPPATLPLALHLAMFRFLDRPTYSAPHYRRTIRAAS